MTRGARLFALRVARHWTRRVPCQPLPLHWRAAAEAAYREHRTLARGRGFVGLVCTAILVAPPCRDREVFSILVSRVVLPEVHPVLDAISRGRAARRAGR